MGKTKEKGQKVVKRNNPNGANQWHADPRQQLFLAYYKDPQSPTFSNAKQSALRAGFTENTANNILSNLPNWLVESLGQLSPLLAIAEKNIKEFMELPNETPAMGMYGPITEKVKVEDGTFKNGKKKFKTVKKSVMKLNPEVMKLKQNSTHFVAETVGKAKYSKRVADTGPIFNVVIFANEQRSRIAKRLIGGGYAGDTDGEGKSD